MKYQTTKSDFKLIAGKWILTDQRTTYESHEHVHRLLCDMPQPFEQSHRLYKQTPGRHRFDTYETVSPDGKRKFVAFVDFRKRA